MADLVVYKKVATQLVPHACGQQTFPSDPLRARGDDWAGCLH